MGRGEGDGAVWFAFDDDGYRRVPSPGGWEAPEGGRPGWGWVPDAGAAERTDRMPRWVRVWARTPFADRSAYVWMWHHGGFDVDPAPGFDVPDDGWSTPSPLASTSTLYSHSSARGRLMLIRERVGFQMVRLEPGGWLVLVVPGAALGLVVGWVAGWGPWRSAVVGAVVIAGVVSVAWVFDRRAYRRFPLSMGFGGMDAVMAHRLADRVRAEGIAVEIKAPDFDRDWRIVVAQKHERRVREVAGELGLRS